MKIIVKVVVAVNGGGNDDVLWKPF